MTATALLSNAVGRGATNARADALRVQALLIEAAQITGRPEYHPGVLDGRVGVGTIGAIESFQRLHCFYRVGVGVIDAAGATFQRLVALQGVADVEASFPFARSSEWSYRTGMRRFGSNRAKGRAHAGSDLYFDEGTDVLAVADGVVVRGPTYFYNSTWAIEIDHGGFVARYGEIQKGAPVTAGDRVERGQVVGQVGHLTGVELPSDMLHFEMYDKTASGTLTGSAAIHPNGRPFLRRMDLLDPTPFLAAWPLPTS